MGFNVALVDETLWWLFDQAQLNGVAVRAAVAVRGREGRLGVERVAGAKLMVQGAGGVDGPGRGRRHRTGRAGADLHHGGVVAFQEMAQSGQVQRIEEGEADEQLHLQLVQFRQAARDRGQILAIHEDETPERLAECELTFGDVDALCQLKQLLVHRMAAKVVHLLLDGEQSLGHLTRKELLQLQQHLQALVVLHSRHGLQETVQLAGAEQLENQLAKLGQPEDRDEGLHLFGVQHLLRGTTAGGARGGGARARRQLETGEGQLTGGRMCVRPTEKADTRRKRWRATSVVRRTRDGERGTGPAEGSGLGQRNQTGEV
mmetsp:Transcript_10288/g.25865  ORF Transcript_10288/g.25865 Transcript_10288/m.25865 type:complete len:317 (-) Transcript_10288:575-1525(-)